MRVGATIGRPQIKKEMPYGGAHRIKIERMYHKRYILSYLFIDLYIGFVGERLCALPQMTRRAGTEPFQGRHPFVLRTFPLSGEYRPYVVDMNVIKSLTATPVRHLLFYFNISSPFLLFMFARSVFAYR